jgi:hypothetical protein
VATIFKRINPSWSLTRFVLLWKDPNASLILLASFSLTAGARRPGAIGQSRPAAATPGAGDACTLLTKADAEAAVGGPVGEGKATNLNDGGQAAKTCAYDGAGGRHIQLNMFFSPPARQVQVYRGLCAQKEQVAGLGGIACWYAKHGSCRCSRRDGHDDRISAAATRPAR